MALTYHGALQSHDFHQDAVHQRMLLGLPVLSLDTRVFKMNGQCCLKMITASFLLHF